MKNAQGDQDTQLLDAIVQGIQEVKGKDIVVLDLNNVPNTVCGYFVVCHGDSATQVESIARSVEEFTRKLAGEKAWHTEGERNAEWILLDYISVVVHIFHRDKRSYYALEDLWGDAARREYENVA
jgi:ribosome-associated protein